MKQIELQKARIFENLGAITQTLGSPARLRILQILSSRPYTVEKISLMAKESVANTSQHLQKLLKAGIVKCEKKGVSRVYQLTSPKVLDVWVSLQELASNLNPQVKADEELICPPTYLSEKDTAVVLRKVKAGRVILVDVRDAEEALSTPAPGAISIPFSEFDRRWKELPKAKTIFVFCRGRYCVMANSAVELLRRKGYDAYRLRENSYQLQKLEESVKL